MPGLRRGSRALLLIAAITLLATPPAAAQTAPRIAQLQVDLWPEYDQPEMLVIYRGVLAADTSLPAALTLRLPARVAAPHAVAYDDGAGNLLQADYTAAVTGDGLAVTFETPARNFQLEFYDSLDRADDRRNYTFVWPGDYAVEQLSLLLLPPPGAAEIQTEPPLSPLQADDDAPRYASTWSDVGAGQEVRLALSYRGGSVLLRERPALPQAGGADSWPLIAAGAAVLLLVIAGGIWYTRRAASRPATVPSLRRPKRSKDGRRRTGRSRYCTHCGRPLERDDRFCGRCGAAVDGR